VIEADIGNTDMIPDSPPPPGRRLWMERGYSRRQIGERMLAAVPELQLFAGIDTQTPPNAHTLPYPDLESIDPSELVSQLNQLIDKNRIEALWPQKSALYDLGLVACDVHSAASPETITLVEDKAAFSAWMVGDPHQAEATEVVGFEAVDVEYSRRHAAGREVCVKPVAGVNGHGFWLLNENAATLFLEQPDVREIHPDLYLSALALAEKEAGPQRLLVMDWLPGPEVSIDLLCWRGIPLVHAARTKNSLDERQIIESEHPTVDHARLIAAKLGFHGIISLQYRQSSEGDWKMLEINPRPAGGSVNSEDAGFGIISGWTKLVSGRAGPGDMKQREDKVVFDFKRIAIRVA
jgi:hypothetical protein